jgi:hypothetical protein
MARLGGVLRQLQGSARRRRHLRTTATAAPLGSSAVASTRQVSSASADVPPATHMSTKWNQTDVEKGSYGFNVRAATAASAGTLVEATDPR